MLKTVVQLAVLLGCTVFVNSLATAQDGPGCLDCHAIDDEPHISEVFQGAHANLNGGGAAVCTSCHGASEAHDRRGRKNPPDISFGPKWLSDPALQNASCLACHDKTAGKMLWLGSAHEQENIVCADCHSSHERRDPALDPQLSNDQCLACHIQQKAQIRLPSRHPIAEGKTACVDCHNPHGTTTEADLHQVTLNDNCYSCHEEKRGPLLWEHEPVTEDCSTCHRPHGSVNDRLLTVRGPALCQQCHSAAFHPSVPYGAQGLPGGNSNRNLLGKNCLNCHSQVHGSNHPSGARLTR
ncbi:MAG: DmsE family decaheme c-type cytochrome [Gammaproteobacteria bacterium]|nr:DmsE family decaheme c-type cytochrome [Gammaproteobacteria bacterium]